MSTTTTTVSNLGANEVHQDSVPALVQNLGQIKLTVGKLLEHLCLVARITGSDVLDGALE
jgi:hypothetical protein